MTEARYRGQKVVVVSPDYSDHTKFADHWLPAQPGTAGALAMAMGHVILKEFYVERQVPYFQDYARRYTDLPCLVTLRAREGVYVPDRFLRAFDLGDEGEHAAWSRRPSSTTRRMRSPSPMGRRATGRRATVTPRRARRCPGSPWSSGTTAPCERS